MAAFQGPLYPNVLPARTTLFRIATPGFPFINVTDVNESFNPGVAESINVSWNPITVKEKTGQELGDGFDVKIDGVFRQTSIPYLQNWYLLGKNPHQLQLKVAGGIFWNFVTEAGTFAAPTGSQLVGMDWEIDLSMKDRVVKPSWHVRLTDIELDWLATNSSSAATGGSSGSALTLNASALDYTARIRSGIKNCTINGVDVGLLDDSGAKLTIKSKADAKDTRGRSLNRKVTVEAEIPMIQTLAADIRATITASQNVYTVIVNTWDDKSFKLTTSASTMPSGTMGDSKNNQTLKIKGEYINNTTSTEFASPDSIDWGVTAPAVVEFKQTGYL